MAARALQAIDAAKLGFSDEIAAGGYEKMSWTDLLRTALTTVGQPACDLGHEGASFLLSRRNGCSGKPRTAVLPASLEVRPN
jgi:DNA-binding LacI/PurR family transcriptional regulator